MSLFNLFLFFFLERIYISLSLSRDFFLVSRVCLCMKLFSFLSCFNNYEKVNIFAIDSLYQFAYIYLSYCCYYNCKIVFLLLIAIFLGSFVSPFSSLVSFLFNLFFFSFYYGPLATGMYVLLLYYSSGICR